MAAMNSAEPLVSVIVPVYGVERYLDECLQSVVSQTYRNLEIIVVDDGSPDRCPDMCDAWAVKDGRIKVIHKNNGGLSTARNAGLDVFSGEYVAFVDSDDWIDEEMIARLYQWMASNADIDVTMCGVIKEFETGGSQNIDANYPERMFSRDEALRSFLYHRDRMTDSVWNKLFSARFFKGKNGLRFPDGVNSEDYYLLSHVYCEMNGLYYNPEPHYHYRIRIGSISTKTRIDDHTYDKVKIAGLVTEDLSSQGYCDQHALAFFRMQAWYDVLYDILGKKPSTDEVTEARKALGAAALLVYRDKSLSIVHRLKVWTFIHFPKPYHAWTMMRYRNQMATIQANSKTN